MSKIDEAMVRNVAKLSRLNLSDGEVHQFAEQMSEILSYVEKMNELDTENVEPLAHCLPMHNVFREDVVKPSLGTEKILANAPDADEDFFKVPTILDDGSSAA